MPINSAICRFLFATFVITSAGVCQDASAKKNDCAALQAGQSYKDCLAQENAKNLKKAKPMKGPAVLDRAVKSKGDYDREVSTKGKDKSRYFSLKEDKTSTAAGENRGLLSKPGGHYQRTLDKDCKGYAKSKIAGGDGRRVQVVGSNKECPNATNGPFIPYKK